MTATRSTMVTAARQPVSASGSCGDGAVQSLFETCDDGFTDACGSCNADCSGAGSGSTCGDGSVCAQTEACDDGNSSNTDACQYLRRRQLRR